MSNAMKKLATLLWLTGGVLCLMVFIYQATPIVLEVFPPTLLLIIGLLFILPIFVFSLFVLVYALWWSYVELQHRSHNLRHQQHMDKLDEQEQEE